MNSTIFDDLQHEDLVSEATKYMENIFMNSKNLAALHKELLEINLSITAYIEESKIRLKTFRFDKAYKAESSQKVVEILSDESSPLKRKCPNRTIVRVTNNDSKTQFSKQQQSARNFIIWYKHMIDDDRQNLSLYLSDDILLEWFGKTIKTRKKVSFFLKYDMQCSRHDFTTIEGIDNIRTRFEHVQRKDDNAILANPLHSPKIEIQKRSYKRKIDSDCHSPQWAEGCKPDDNEKVYANKRARKMLNFETSANVTQKYKQNEINISEGDNNDMSTSGDGVSGRLKRKYISITPPNIECGQGDCLPSTSGTSSSEAPHEKLNAQLPKLSVECNGYIEFTRTRNNRSTESMKWERKCKVQISYSEDPLNVGEYIIWALLYSDESKCRRNLLAAFEEASKA